MQGPDPLVLTRSYSSGYSSGQLGYNWEFNRPHSLIIKKYTSSNVKKTFLKALLHHPSGIKTIHEVEESNHHISSLPISCTRALTNCRSEEISGRTNLHNTSLKINRDKTVYTYNKEHRPVSISRFARSGKLYSKEKFVWNEGENELGFHDIFGKKVVQTKIEITNDVPEMVTEIANLSSSMDAPVQSKISHQQIMRKLLKQPSSKDSVQVGNLIGKYLKGSDGKIEHALFFAYDSRGNIKKEIFYGNLTGTCQVPIELDELQIPRKNKCEYYQKEFTYSNDAYNHLLTEKEDNGKEIEYTYDSHTQQVSAKYIKDKGDIQLRQFFFYDPQTASLIKVIKDDGSHRNPEKLNNVKERIITTLTLNDHFPFGLPKIIEEKYLDSNEEHLLKRVKCRYDSKGHLCRQDHFDANACLCYSLFWTYDSHGNVTEEINALGHKIIKHYDDHDHLIREEGPRQNDTTEYEYDFAGRLIQIKRHADGKSLVTIHRYDLRNQRIATIDSFGQTKEYEYDEFNRLIKTTYPPIQLTEDWIFTPKEEILAYDINNRPIKTKDAGGFETSLTYNARGKPITKTYPDGTTEHFEYDKEGTLAKSIAANGTSTVYKRDYLGRVIQEEIFDAHSLSLRTFTYKGSKLISKVDPEGNSTTYSYDGAGRLISETCGKISKTYAYDALNRVSKVIQFFGINPQDLSVQAFTYDNLNQVTEERLEDAFGNILQRIFYTYDELGNKTATQRETESGISLSRVEYQADGKPLKMIDPEGNITHFTYNQTHRNHLNQIVLKVIKTDPQGRNTTSIFDALGRLREVINQDAFGNLLAKQEIYYDPMGRRIKTIDSIISDGAVQRHFINAWRYHPSGQEDLIVEALGTPHQKTTSIFYNSLSQKEKVVKPNGIGLDYTYDSFGRLKTLRSSDNTIAYDFTYNLNHQIKEVQDLINHTITQRHYEKEGDLKEETLGNGLHLTHASDRMGRLTNLSLPDHSSVTYIYNAAYLQGVQRHKNNQLLYEYQPMRHDLSGNLMQANLIGLAGSLNFSYDLLGRTQSINHSNWSQHIPGYDHVGRLIRKMTHDQAGLREDHFTYNDLDHLQTESGHVSHAYKTDSLHNRLQKNGLDCSINAANQLTEHINCKYLYDGNGNLQEKIKDHQKNIYTYDALDRLISVSSPEGLTTYTYDAFHRRLSKTSQGMTLRYLYQGQDEIGCVNPQGEITELRILGVGIEAEIGASVALELNGKIYAPIHDHAGNIACLIDAATGQTAETYLYSAFGEETILNAQGVPTKHSQVGNPWRFASKRADQETSWIYFGRRYYDPENGRWTTPDPLGFADGSNLYTYLHHNPLTAYDAYGLVGEAYRDSVEVGMNAPHYSVFSDLGSSEIQNNDQDRASYISNAVAGVFHGGMNFFTNQLCDFASLSCLIGSHELEDGWDERFNFHLAYSQWQIGQMGALDDWMTDCLCANPNNSIYQNCRSYTTAGLEIGSLAIGGYGLAKAGVKLARVSFSTQGAKIAGKVVTQELKYVVSSGAENVNAGINLSKKLSQVETAQQTAVKTRLLDDGRIRYYSKEYLSKNEGLTRGACRVTEINFRNGYSRSWHECYNHFGNINRIHPKTINGQDLISSHYPPTVQELGY